MEEIDKIALDMLKDLTKQAVSFNFVNLVSTFVLYLATAEAE